MHSPELTWGDARRFHQHMTTMGMVSPDDLLANPHYAELAEGQPDDALVFPADEEVTYWYTTDEESGRVLELLMTDEVDGVISVRTGGSWEDVKPNEESPSVYGPEMHKINPEVLEEALKQWDESETSEEDPTLADVESHLA